METIQYWLFIVGVYIIYKILQNTLTDWVGRMMKDEGKMFFDPTANLIMGSFLLICSLFMSINLYIILFR